MHIGVEQSYKIILSRFVIIATFLQNISPLALGLQETDQVILPLICLWHHSWFKSPSKCLFSDEIIKQLKRFKQCSCQIYISFSFSATVQLLPLIASLLASGCLLWRHAISRLVVAVQLLKSYIWHQGAFFGNALLTPKKEKFKFVMFQPISRWFSKIFWKKGIWAETCSYYDIEGTLTEHTCTQVQVPKF